VKALASWLGLLAGLLLLVAGCEFLWGDPLGFTAAQQATAKSLLARPLEERLHAFDSLSVADQYGVYRYGWTREPPALEFQIPLARHGAELLSLVRGRLEAHGDLGEVHDDLALLAEIHRLGTADVAADAALMTLLKKRVSGLRSPLWREGCAEQVAALEQPADSSGVRVEVAPR
jgi:hypothetical protein